MIFKGLFSKTEPMIRRTYPAIRIINKTKDPMLKENVIKENATKANEGRI